MTNIATGRTSPGMEKQGQVIPLMNLKAQTEPIEEEINKAINRVVDKGNFIDGEQVAAFEKEFASYCGTRYALGVASGTDALYLSLRGLGIGSGDQVITASFTFVGTAEAIILAGAEPVFVDISPETFNMDPEKLEGAVNGSTAAIMPVHLYGQPADMDPIKSVARRHGLAVIEDAAQAHGAEYGGKRAGAMSDVGCFSFYPSKNLGAMGDAGALVTDNESLYRTLKSMRNHGRGDWNEYDIVGVNSRMDEIQAAVLRVKLKHLEKWNEERRSIATRYDRLLANLPGIVIPGCLEKARHVYHLYVIKSNVRGALKEKLAQQGVSTGIYYPLPVHLQKAYRNLGAGEGSYPVSEEVSGQVLSLPIWPGMDEELVEETARRVKTAVALL